MLDVLLRLLTKSVQNDSLCSGNVPVILKQAAVLPFLKKQDVDSEQIKNYKPVSNLPYVTNKLMTYHIFWCIARSGV